MGVELSMISVRSPAHSFSEMKWQRHCRSDIVRSEDVLEAGSVSRALVKNSCSKMVSYHYKISWNSLQISPDLRYGYARAQR